MPEVCVFPDAEALARAAAACVLDAGRESFAARGQFRIGLSGGETPRRLYALLAQAPLREELLGFSPVFLFADERAVAPQDPASNYRMVRETLLAPAGIADEKVHRMRSEAESLEEASREYEAELVQPIDLLILGIGPDGHTASIFPDSAAARETTTRVLAVTDSPKPPPRRLTITPRVIAEARRVVVLAMGADKAEVVARAMDDATDPAWLPARRMRGRDWFLDEAAAARMVGRSASRG